MPVLMTSVQCGANPVLPPERVGCGGWIGQESDIYRCVDCGVPFHKWCLKKHCEDDLSAALARAEAAERARDTIARERDQHSRDVLTERRLAEAAERERDEAQAALDMQRDALQAMTDMRNAAERERDEARAERDEALKDIRDLLARAYTYDDKPHQLFSAVATMARRWGRREGVPEIVRLMDYEYAHVWDHHRAASAAASLRERVRALEDGLRLAKKELEWWGDRYHDVPGDETEHYANALLTARVLLAAKETTE